MSEPVPPESQAGPSCPGTIELLAPAGGPDAGLAAFQFGADAIYLGLKRFSARADAENFSLEELDAIVGFAHGHAPRRRVFVTVNTLVLHDELPLLVETLGALADIGADAVIVQDLGVAHLARRFFPELELHASTQMAVHDPAGVEVLRDLGFRRVTLARELSLSEIRGCAAVPGVEIETFVHGALCYAYSGLCLFSSQMVGRSGNRGRCAYPCRDRWRVESLTERSPGTGLPGRVRSGFAFSMKDLALPDWLEGLRQAGVACLKIEGRKKSPLYVATTVDFYRRLLDGRLPPPQRPRYEADLQAVFSRPWTDLYLRSPRHRDVADRDIVGHRGAHIGMVESVVRHGKTFWVRFRSSRDLSRHDGLQIDVPGLDRPFGFPVGTLRLAAARRGETREVLEAPAGSTVEVALPEEGHPTLPAGAPVYCSSSQAVKQRFSLVRPNLRAVRARLGMQVEAHLDERSLRLCARVPSRTAEASCEGSGPFEVASDPVRMTAAARQAFAKLGDSRFFLESLDWCDPQGRFVPISRLNELRRRLVEELERQVRASAQRRAQTALAEVGVGAANRASAVPVQALKWSIRVDRLAFLERLEDQDWAGIEEVVIGVGREPLAGLPERLEPLVRRMGRGRVRLALPLITRRWEAKSLRAKIARLRSAGFDRWQAAGVSAWSFLRGGTGAAPVGSSVDLAADWSIYVTNRAAALQVLSMGASGFTLSPEDSLENMGRLLAEFGERATVIVYQDTPLFISESCPYANLQSGCVGPARCRYQKMELTSSHGGKVLALNQHCRTVVLNAVPFSLAGHLEALAASGARRVCADFIHRPYTPEEVRDLWRSLRQGRAVPGHPAFFVRGGLSTEES